MKWLCGAALVVLGACSSSAPSNGGSSGETPPPGSADGGPNSAPDASSNELACTEGMPTSFASSKAWSLPAARCSTRFDAFASTMNVAYALLDVSADSAPELIVTSDTCDADIGRKHWDVYDNDAKGFAATSRSFAIPASRCGTSFDGVGGSDDKVAYTVVDLDGDRIPDLVVTRDTCTPEVGTARWDVYRGGRAGFAATPDEWQLPAASCGSKFDSIASSDRALTFGLQDFDGDRRPELVLYGAQCDADIGTKAWTVYANDGSGFGAPSNFGLPAARCGDDWRAPARRTPKVDYSLLDLGGDRKVDLVVTFDDCDADVGEKHWHVYDNRGDAFAAAPRDFHLPTKRCGSAFDRTARADDKVTFGLVDFSCDGIADLIVAADQCDDEVGARHWDVYRASSGGFADKSSPLTLPAARCGARWNSLGSSATGEPLSFGLFALDGASVGLTVPRDDCDGDIGSKQWDFYGLVSQAPGLRPRASGSRASLRSAARRLEGLSDGKRSLSEASNRCR